MADSLLQASFDATLEEFVDVGMRLSAGTAAFHRRRVRSQWQFGVMFVVVAAYVFQRQRSQVSPLEWASLAAVLLPVGAALVFGYRWFHDWHARRAYRAMFIELLGSTGPVCCEFEVCDDRLVCKTPHGDTTLPWSRSTRVRADGPDIELWFAPGLAVVRGRAFRSPEHRAAFVAAVIARAEHAQQKA